MTRKMYDSAFDVPSLPPEGPFTLFAAYKNGVRTSGNYALVVAAKPNSQVLGVSTNGAATQAELECDIADCENGDYSPQKAAFWAHQKIVYGMGRPTIYCGRANYYTVALQLLAYGLKWGRDVDCWLATLDGTQTSTLTGVVAIQYWDNGAYDSSIVLEDSWHWLAPPDPPSPGGDDEMWILAFNGTGQADWLVMGDTKMGVANMEELNEHISQGVPIRHYSLPLYQKIVAALNG